MGGRPLFRALECYLMFFVRVFRAQLFFCFVFCGCRSGRGQGGSALPKALRSSPASEASTVVLYCRTNSPGSSCSVGGLTETVGLLLQQSGYCDTTGLLLLANDRRAPSMLLL